ncbi:uncharacterized protein LOC130275594 isoform X2 [Hyla sarda]|uniref:uncharacterized protein LOC130275594 isoform X2 n=1 Tax=Hyla sarda TaxID=327740 RepID=UPI0024C3658A|nr:uncharacterized protein LOC130275594 isoform X2 [Hyla sarda]
MRTAHAPETRHVTTDGRMARLTRRVPASSNKEPASRQTEAFGEDDQDITARRPMMNMNNENSGHEDSGEIRRSHIMVLQGKGVTSLVLTLLNLFLHGLLSILQKYRYLIWVSLNILIVGGFMYYYFDDNASCLSDRESLKIQLIELEAKAESEKRLIEGKLQSLQKLKDFRRNLTGSFDQVLLELKLEESDSGGGYTSAIMAP